MNRLSILLACVLMLTPFAAFADNQDEGLYDPVAPKGSAFVRFINADPSLAKGSIPTANGKAYDEVSFAEVSPYYVFPKGELKTAFADASTATPLEEGKFYTQVLRADRIQTLNDVAENTNPNKAQVLFYNLSVTSEVSLKTADGKIAITPEPVKSGGVSGRALNAVKLSAAVYGGEAKLAPVEPLILERGKAYAVVVMSDADGEPKVVSVASRTDTTK